jgi:hypothetical protein
MKISVITPSVRPKMLEVMEKCLDRQDFQSFEWLVIGPGELFEDQSCFAPRKAAAYEFIEEPPKKEGDFYALCKAWNKGFQEAKGELIVVIQDGIWFPPDMLSRFWGHYQANKKGLVTAIGHHYDQLDQYGKPVNMMWQDPRARMDHGSFYEVAPSEMEMAVCSVPKQAVLDCGGIDEDYDKGAAVGEKEMCWRLDKLGYKFYIDQTIEYRAIHHPRLSEDWDEKYKVSSAMFVEHMNQLQQGQRTLNVGYVNDKMS